MAAAFPFPRNQPLPLNPFNPNIETPAHDAYHYCLLNQSEAGNDPKRLMYARCLGFLIREAPDANARDVIVHEILQCGGDRSEMDTLALFYINHLIRLFKQNKGKTPVPSEHPSRPSFEMHKNFFGVAVDPAPKDHSSAKDAALVRDKFRCMVSGDLDLASYRDMSDEEKQRYDLSGPHLPPATVTNYCHIFPPSTNWDLKPEEEGHPKTNYSGDVWGIVNRFASIDVLAELNGTQLDRLSNGLTMDSALHNMFDMLCLWFEEVPNVPNTYTLCTSMPIRALPVLVNQTVTFATTTDLELPNPRYLKLHAAICRVAHMSGAADYLDFIDREYERRKVLSSDGTSAELLVSRLSAISQSIATVD